MLPLIAAFQNAERYVGLPVTSRCRAAAPGNACCVFRNRFST